MDQADYKHSPAHSAAFGAELSRLGSARLRKQLLFQNNFMRTGLQMEK